MDYHAKCKLCLQKKKLVKSHIIPEFFYKPVYEKGLHRLNVFSTNPDEKDIYLQKGIREKLLCNNCEKLLSKFEDYTYRTINNTPEKQISLQSDEMHISGIDYTKFKLCLLSILWRASVSQQDFFSDIKLGPHEEKIRKMILYENPKKINDYGFLTIGLLDDNNKLLNSLISQPYMAKDPDGFRCFFFMFGGFRWIFIISSHNSQFKFREKFFGVNNILNIWLTKARQDDHILSLGKGLREAGKIKYK